MPRAAFWSGWILFAGIMMLLIGAYNLLQGLAAIFSDDYYLVGEDDLLVFDFTAWGWIMLIWGVVLCLVGFGLVTGKAWSRWAGIAVAGLNAVAQAAFLSAFPLWSILVVGLCVLVIFALAARWDEAQADMTGTVSGAP
jgi:hypothetical protein